MKLVNQEPVIKKRKKGSLVPLFETFCALNTERLKVEFEPGEYKDNMSCYMSIYRSLQYYSQYPVKVRFYNREIYLERTDMGRVNDIVYYEETHKISIKDGNIYEVCRSQGAPSETV